MLVLLKLKNPVGDMLVNPNSILWAKPNYGGMHISKAQEREIKESVYFLLKNGDYPGEDKIFEADCTLKEFQQLMESE